MQTKWLIFFWVLGIALAIALAVMFYFFILAPNSSRVGLNDYSVESSGLTPIKGVIGGNEGIVWFDQPASFLHYAKAWNVEVVFDSENHQRAWFACNGTIYGYEW